MEDSRVLLPRPDSWFQVAKMVNTTNKSLPEELVVEILLKLPAKSLKRFRCVCKSWLSYIESPDFVRNHYRTNKITGSNRNALVEGILGNDDSYKVYILSNESMLVSKILEDHKFHVIGEECEGVVLVSGESYGLLNPATREFRPVPDPSFERPFYIMATGFGYDSRNGDYKLIRFVEVDGGRQIELYSLCSNRWRQIDVPHWRDTSVSIHHGRLNTYVNGCCHWGFNHGEAILAFDMTRESFHLIDFPFDCVGLSSQQRYDCTRLRVFNNHLAVFVRSTKSNLFEIWVMEEYGVKESWTKQFEIGPIATARDLLGMWKTDEWFFIDTDNRFAIYNSKTKVIEAPEIHNGAFTFGESRHSFVMFTENLFSLNRHA